MAIKKKPSVANGSEKTKTRLTALQLRFIDEYLMCGNAAESARRAGYSAKTARSMGAENLTKPDIQAKISERSSEIGMRADEALTRLAEFGRGTLEHFVNVGPNGILSIDLESDGAKANFHLLKKIKPKTRVGPPQDPWTEQEIELELHDPLSALRQIGTYHGLFSDAHKNHQEVEKQIAEFWQMLNEKLTPDDVQRIRDAIAQ